MVIAARQDGGLTILSRRYGSFDWPRFVDHEGGRYRFTNQDALVGNEVSHFGGKSLYEKVEAEAAR